MCNYRKVHGPGTILVDVYTNARPSMESSQGWWTERDDFEFYLTLTMHGRLKLSGLISQAHSPEEASPYTNGFVMKNFPIVQLDRRMLP